VHKRTSLILSLKSLHTRMTGRDLGTGRIKAMEPQEAEKLFEHPADQLITRLDLQLVEQLGQSIQQIEAAILAQVKSLPHYQVLADDAGGGEDFRIDDHAGDGRSQAFCQPGGLRQLLPVRGQPADVQRQKERGKQRQVRQQISGLGLCGGGQLRPAPRRSACRKFYDRKKAQVNGIVATKALACKLAKAAWHMMSQNTPYDAGRMFPGPRNNLGRAGASQRKGLASSPQD
jgi:transposase